LFTSFRCLGLRAVHDGDCYGKVPLSERGHGVLL
jgi:hypothetical protein